MDTFTIFWNIVFFQELSYEKINILIGISIPKFLQKKEKLVEPGRP